MEHIKISAVSYLNTLPFIYGIRFSGLLNSYDLVLDVPSTTAKKIASGETDLGLIPVGALPEIEGYRIISPFCLGAVGKVKTVLLLGNAPLDNIKTIYLDEESRTSVQLVQILAEHYWKIKPEWKPLAGINITNLADKEGVVMIGDKTFGIHPFFRYAYDLADEWYHFTSLPFVFAVWATIKEINDQLISRFNSSLEWGLQHINEAVELSAHPLVSRQELVSYLTYDISFNLDENKRKGMELYLSYF